MDRATTTPKTNAERPSLVGSFARAFGSGAFNSSLMMGIFAGVGTLIMGSNPVGWLAAGTAILATGIFSGVMGVKKTLENTPSTPTAQVHTRPAQARSHTQSQTVDLSQDYAPQLRTDWAERTGRSGGQQANIQGILNNGSMADKDRAQEILLAREAQAASTNERF